MAYLSLQHDWVQKDMHLIQLVAVNDAYYDQQKLWVLYKDQAST